MGQDLHHLIEGSRCSVRRWSPRVPRRSRDAPFSWRTASCSGRTARRPRNCAILRRASAGNRNVRRIAIPRPSPHRGTVEWYKRSMPQVHVCVYRPGCNRRRRCSRGHRHDRYNIHQETVHKTIVRDRTHARLISPWREAVCPDVVLPIANHGNVTCRVTVWTNCV